MCILQRHHTSLSLRLPPLFFVLLLIVYTSSKAMADNPTVLRGERLPIDLEKVTDDAFQKGVMRIKLSKDSYNKISQHGWLQNDESILITGKPSVDTLNVKYQVYDAKKTFESPALKNKYRERHEKWGFHLWIDLFVDPSTDITKMVMDYQELIGVKVAEPHYRIEPLDNITENPAQPKHRNKELCLSYKKDMVEPEDPLFSDQWHYHNTGQTEGTPGADISLPLAWNLETGNPEVIVAIVDSGVDYEHPDLEGNMWEHIGYNFIHENEEITPGNHGTHVAGTIGAVNNNSEGVSGIAGGWGELPGVSLMSAQIFWPGPGSGGHAAAQIYAADHGAVISQNSWKYNQPNVYEQAVLDAIDYFNAHGGGDILNGGITVFGAGNDNNSLHYYPGYYHGTLAVAGTNHKDQKAWYSNFADYIDIAAPGGETSKVDEEGVMSTVISDYGYMQGTSMACPHVSGVLALMASMVASDLVGEMTTDHMIDILINTADPIDHLNPDYVNQLGSGRVNAYAAMQKLRFYMAEPDAPGSPENLHVHADPEGDLIAELTWDNPSATATGEPLTNIDSVYIFRDKKLIATLPGEEPGKSNSYIDTGIYDDNMVNYKVRVSNVHGTGLLAIDSIYVGHDAPAAPMKATLYPAGDNAAITWEHPEQGYHDGFFDGINLRYAVTRFPCDMEVANDLSRPVFYDDGVPGQGNYYYSITASNDIGTGGSSLTSENPLGEAGLLMFEPFDLPEGDLPEDWYVEGEGENNWGTYDSATAGGTPPEMRFRYNPGFVGISYLVTPNLDASSFDQVKLTFKQFLHNHGSSAGEISVHYAFDDDLNWQQLFFFDGLENYGPKEEEFFIDLPGEENFIRFAFSWEGVSYDIWDWNIDDVICKATGAYYDVKISVEDEDAQPLDGAHVSFNENPGLEILSGTHLFSLIEPGQYSFTVQKEGYKTHEGTIEVTDNHVSTTVTLERKRYTVSFEVYDEQGEEIPDAIVTLNSLTNDPGSYAFHEIEPGVYFYLVERENYMAADDSLVVTDSDVEEQVVMYADETPVPDADENILSIYPNPANEVVHVKSVLRIDLIRVFSSSTGELIYEDSVNAYYTNMDVSDLCPGMYVVELQADNKIMVQKLQVFR